LVILGGSPNDAQTRPRLATPELSREEFREPEHVFYLTSWIRIESNKTVFERHNPVI
jgi:hypothetical protein